LSKRNAPKCENKMRKLSTIRSKNLTPSLIQIMMQTMFSTRPYATPSLVAPRSPLHLLLLSFLALSFLASPAHAQTPTPPNILVTLAPLDRKTGVELAALTVDATISETDNHTFAQGTLTWKVHNTDTANETTIVVGFPQMASASEAFDPTKFTAFRVLFDDKSVVLAPATADVVYGDVSKDVTWYTFELTLQPDEKKVITGEFTQDLGDGLYPRFTYGMLVGNRWKNEVGSARVTVTLPAQTTGDQFISLDPIVPKFDGETLTWLWESLNPEADPGVTFIRPSVWQTLIARRADATKNPDDANAQLALGRVYQQLASQDSPRRDNFLAQAVAALETAARLAPNNVDAVKTLAQLYEQRAGAANGPRDVNYLALAMDQWQKLIGTSSDANARKQLGEDTFYLALDALSRNEYDRALKFLDDASNFAPDGAGPLYTRDRYDNQVKLTHIAAARADIQNGSISNALIHVRAAYGDNFQPATNLPSEALALNHAEVKTTLTERDVVFNLIPYPAPSDSLRDATNQIVTALNQSGAGRADLATDANGYTLTLKIPFSGDNDLRTRLVKLASVIPARTDWALVRAALVPALLELSSSDDNFSRKVNYKEQVDLSGGQQEMQSTLNEMSATLGQLSTASPDDPEAQLKLALVTNAQQWWYKQLGALTLDYSFDAGSGVTRQWTISPNAPRTLEYDAEAIRGEFYVIGAAVGVGVLLLIVVVLAVLTRRRKPRRAL
jgi:tetratricopeptide (TPR) repeat protein